jgi:methionyl-tRNA formyltransferase
VSRPRVLFFGYSEVGYECLDLLLTRGDRVVALITHEDNPNEKIWFKTPAAAARDKDIPIFTPEKVNTPEWVERIAALQPDLILSVYYRNMISSRILALPRLGAFNLHGSLLPKYRGRAPINWAVLHGEPRIGMTLHRMVKQADAGAIVDQEGVDLGPRDTAEQAFRKVLPCARRVLARQIDALLAGTAPETPQDESQATYFGGRKPEDGRIDWTQTSRQIFDLIRAVTDPYPGAFTEVGTARLMVWWAEPDTPATRALYAESNRPGEILSLVPLVVATGDGALELTRAEWQGDQDPLTLRVGQVL